MRAFTAGMLGAAMFAVAGALARQAGIPFDLEWLQGSFFTGADDARGLAAYVIGLLVQLAVGGVLGLIYAAILTRAPAPTVGAGAFVGVLHALIAGVLLVAVPPLHPAVPEGLPAPGLLMMNRGADAAVLFVALHVVFGALMGLIAVPTTDLEARRRARAFSRRGRAPQSLP